MKKLLILLGVISFLITSCEDDYLDVTAPSNVDEDFVFASPADAQKVMNGIYDLWYDLDRRMYYDTEVVGSDSERHPEIYSAQQRHIPE